MSKFRVASLLRLLSVSVLFAQSSFVMAVESPTNLPVLAKSPTQVDWDWVNGTGQYSVDYAGIKTKNAVVGTRSNSLVINNFLNSVASDYVDTDIVGSVNNELDNNAPVDPASYGYAEVFEKDGYELAFSDEFNGYNLNSNKWNTQLRWDGEYNGERYEYRVINSENQFYVNIYSNDQEHLDNVAPTYNPFEFDGSRLAIRAIRNPLNLNNNNADHGPLNSIVTQQEFLSGAISTYDKFTQKYGYFEARIKIPSQVGSFPAFWLHHQRRTNDNTQKTEIDIMENLGHAPWYIYNSFHYFTDVSDTSYGKHHSIKPAPGGQVYNGTDFSLDYHTYAVEWSPGYIAWYLDGQKVSEVWDGNVDHEELYVILNLAMGGSWTNFPENLGGIGRAENDIFPNWDDISSFSDPALEIDYVRVYKRK